jgi:hypothetical protein
MLVSEIHSKSSYEMTCDVVLIRGDVRVTVTVIVDSGCQEELTLEPSDIEALHLSQLDTHNVEYPDGSTGEAKLYDDVVVEVPLSDGSVVRATVAPVSLEQLDDRVGAITVQRILGYPALYKLNLKLDFRAKKLVKRVRRI